MVSPTFMQEDPRKEKIVRALFSNVQSLYVEMKKLQSEVIEGDNFRRILETVELCIKNGRPDNKKIMSDDKIRAYVDIFKLVYDNFPEFTSRLFGGYREAEKISGSYLFLHEVEEYCRKTEPKILKTIRS